MIGDGKSWLHLAKLLIRTYTDEYGRRLTKREKRLLINYFFQYPPLTMKEIDRRLKKRRLHYRFRTKRKKKK